MWSEPYDVLQHVSFSTFVIWHGRIWSLILIA